MFFGVTSIAVRTAGVTVSVAVGDEVTESNSAVMFVEPTARAVASPFELDALLMVATPAFEVDQVAHVVRLCVVLQPPDSVPMATNCCVNPFGILVLVGVTAIDPTWDEARVTNPGIPSYAARISAVPASFAIASPFELAVLPTSATVVFNDIHVAKAVRFC